MGIQTLIQKRCVDTIVYWGSPVDDGYGGYTYDAPVEIMGRWEDIEQIIKDDETEDQTSRAVVYILQDVDVNGVMFKGTLDDLYDEAESSAGALTNPKDFANTYVVKRFKKTPAMGSTTEFLRVAYLTPSLSFGGF